MNLGYQCGLRAHQLLIPGLSRQIIPSFRRLHTEARVQTTDSQLIVPAHGASFPHRWLRDACQCATCVHPSTSQKLHRTSDIPADVRPIPHGVTFKDSGIHIEWADDHKSFYKHSFLERYSSTQRLSSFHKDVRPISWDVSTISKAPDLYMAYEAIKKPSQLLAAITQLTRYGLLFLTGVPNTENTDETCEVRKLADMFGEVRETFYGRLWDVKNIRNSKNIAYTNLDLGMHMDLLYFQHPPRYQILHCIRNRVSGGISRFVDGLHAAETLYKTHPVDFDTLATTPVPFHYVNDGHHLHYEHPTIELASLPAVIGTGSPTSAPSVPEINCINYAPPFQAPLLLDSTPPAFYDALGRYAAMLEDPVNVLNYALREGDAVLFDNRRVLHARTSFTDDGRVDADGEMDRWLKGCYLQVDTVLDRARMLRTKLEKGSL
ncbi:Clavaminate synthase-like protein [Suillus decipiens]|nr:Clavaminate synthase-like protein [Suillus decipiens]